MSARGNSEHDLTPRTSQRLGRLIRLAGAACLLSVTGVWWFSLSQTTPPRLAAVTALCMLAAAAVIAVSTGRWGRIAIVVAALNLAFWFACAYRLPREGLVAPWLDLAATPFAGIGFGVLLAAATTFLWGQAVKWLEAPERIHFPLFLLGLLPLLLLSVDLAFYGKAPLQPLRPRNYHPYLTYAVEDSYAYQHAQESQVVDLKGIRFQQRKPAGAIRIVLCGASTVWGAGVAAPDSLPQVLQAELKRRYADRNFEVITVAFPGKYQLNELIDATITLPHWEPDLVISMNGFNEIWYGEESNRYEGMPYIEAQMRDRGTLACLTARFSHLGALYFAATRDQMPSPYRLAERDENLEPRYSAYLRSTASGWKRRGVPYVFAFCPNLEERNPRTAEEQRILDQGGLSRTGDWRKAAAKRRNDSESIVLAESQFSYDVMSVINRSSETVFLDECHLNERGIQLVAADLAERIPAWVEPGNEPESR